MKIFSFSRIFSASRLGLRARRYSLLCALLAAAAALQAQTLPTSLEISRAAHPWEFMDAVGPRAALLGDESGRFEAWVYPLKILRNFHLIFHAEEHALPAEALARSVIVRPESTTIVYASDTFSVRETLVVPIDKPGGLIFLEIHSAQPMEVEASFERDFQLEWPAILADPEIEWTPAQHGFTFACERPELTAILGSPTATVSENELTTNYFSTQQNSFRLGPSKPGEDHKLIVLAASLQGEKELQATYKDLTTHADQYRSQTADAYRQYLARTVSLELPDAELQQAYDWARISLAQSMVDNPLVGRGMVAGYRVDAGDRRPGYDWFFGRDALWSALGLDASGDFASSRAALEFLSRFQREDGKITHEVPQSTGPLQPLQKTPSAYAAADATPLYPIAFDDYVTRSGDLQFARDKWTSLQSAIKFLRATFDTSGPAAGLAANDGNGHGWVEGGPLYPAYMEYYQAGLGVEALRAWAHLARATGHDAEASTAEAEFSAAKSKLESSFWMPAANHYAFNLDSHGTQVDAPSVEATVPIWFGLTNEAHAQAELDELARPEHQTDWGMRIIASTDSRYNPSGYHWGSVWPLFTGWASVAEYRSHRTFAAYQNLRANALLTFSGAAGHVTEVLSGDAHQGLAASTPDQTWSSAMVIEPLLLGLFDLQVDALTRRITLSPQLPAGWNGATLRNIPLGDSSVDLRLTREPESAERKPGQTELTRLTVTGNVTNALLEWSPSFSPHARILRASVNGRSIPFTVAAGSLDQRTRIELPLDGHPQTLEVRTEGDVRLGYDATLPVLGDLSQGPRLTHESWSPDGRLWTLQFEGPSSASFDFPLYGAQEILSVDGAQLLPSAKDGTHLHVQLPASLPVRATVTLHLTAKK
jgi:glycogen debranching enzyme